MIARTAGVAAVVILTGCGPTTETIAAQPQPQVEFAPHTVVRTVPDPTRSPAPRPHLTRRASRSRVVIDGAVAWASTGAARAVAQCESGNDGSARSHSGTYRGKWQMDADFWRTYGGLQYASSPDYATVAEQDAVAYRGWLARGWQPWECARIVGVYP